MAEAETKTIFAITIYFIILTFMFYSVAQFSSYYGLEQTLVNSTGGGIDLLLEDGYSADPRFPELQQVITFNNFGGRRTISRDITPTPFIEAGVIFDEDSCTAYNDFSWITKKRWIFFGETTETCDGYLDVTFYNDGVDYDVSTSWGGRYINKPVCELASLQLDQTLAERFGCTWYDPSFLDETTDIKGRSTLSNVWNAIKMVATMRVSVNTQYTIMNALLSLFLVWLPLLLLLVSIAFWFRKIVGWT